MDNGYEKITLGQVDYLGESWATDEINELRGEVARLKADNARLADECEGAQQSLKAWFDTSKKAEEELTPILLDAIRGYLRTSRAGGMPKELSDAVEGVLADFCEQHAGRAVLPVIRGIAEGTAITGKDDADTHAALPGAR